MAIPGQRLLLHTEQIEDVLIYGRFIASAASRSEADVLLDVPPAARRLASAWRGVTILTDCAPVCTRQCALHFLPSRVPASADLCPWPSFAEIEAWSGRFAWARGTRIGVAAADADLLAALWKISGVTLVALPGLDALHTDAGVLVHDWTDRISDLAVLAGLIVQLDLVIADPGLAAHLAAALGRPVWLRLPAAPAFPWIAGREDNPWYPSLRQFPVSMTAEKIAGMAARLGMDQPEDALCEDGFVRLERGERRAAASCFRQALALRPDHKDALTGLAAAETRERAGE